MQFFLNVKWRLMKGNKRLVDLRRTHQMVMEVLGLGMSFKRCKGQGRGKSNFLEFLRMQEAS